MAEEDSNLSKFNNRGAAWFKLIFGVVYMAFGFACLVMFFRSRHVFEIRARSAYLVTFLGMILLVNQGLNVDLHAIVLFDADADYYNNSLAVFFYTFTVAAIYICRVVRLTVAFSPKIKRAVPWLMSERLLIMASLTVGILAMGIPLYYRYTITEDPWESEYRSVQQENIWTCTVALQAIQASLIPVVWMIDDLFHISVELIVIIVLGLIQSVVNKLVLESILGEDVQRWINASNMSFLAACILFWLSVVDPVRRLIFSPMASTSPAMARAYERSQNSNTKATTSVSRDSESHGRRTNSSSSADNMWNYEKIAGIPDMSTAFKTFANRALCQDSVCFLGEVSRYQAQDYRIAESKGDSLVAAFEAITRRFIVDGAPDEINISGKDKKWIMQLYNTSTDTFDPLDQGELRMAFDRPYGDVRFMLESNILSKFMKTEEFAKAAKECPRIRKRRFCFP